MRFVDTNRVEYRFAFQRENGTSYKIMSGFQLKGSIRMNSGLEGGVKNMELMYGRLRKLVECK
jgi:hypothetical protein